MSHLNFGNPALDLIDPTPNIYSLFVEFDKKFFWQSLSTRAVVRWSKRMYSSAGSCSYKKGELCDIALSEPLLKLRPRKDLVETLLHEMIHAYLFVTNNNDNRREHGPYFKQHMFRINKAAGLNITIYHEFHDEVELYKTHWWRCDGPCQGWKPHFGIVRRSVNRAPGPSSFWWTEHQRKCGGKFIKYVEPTPKKKTKIDRKANNYNISKSNVNIVKPVLRESNNNNLRITNTKNILKTNVVVKQINTNIIQSASISNSFILDPLTSHSNKLSEIDVVDHFKKSDEKLLHNNFIDPNDLVNCPICDQKIYGIKINNHLDECLNNDIIAQFKQNNSVKQEIELIDLTNTNYTKTLEIINEPNDVILIDDEGDVPVSSKLSFNCPCCGVVTESIEEHLEDCCIFNNTILFDNGASTSSNNTNNVDIHDETMIHNATGTMSPCPCCMKMVEINNMSNHLDNCLGSSFVQNFDDI